MTREYGDAVRWQIYRSRFSGRWMISPPSHIHDKFFPGRSFPTFEAARAAFARGQESPG
jgi:hypothetical protein